MKNNNPFIAKKTFMLVTVIVLLLSMSVLSYAQEVKKVGTSAASFLRIHVGARGTALGGAFVSIADDPTCMFWNPGGLPRLERMSLTVDHTPWLPGLDFNFVGFAIPLGAVGTAGLSVTALTTEDMLVTTPDFPMGTGETFSAGSYAVGLSFGSNLTDRFSIGGTFKYITERIMNSSASAIAFDIGTVYDTPFSGVRLGVSIANFGTKLQMDGEDLNVRVDIAPDQKGNNQSVVGRLKTDAFALPLIMRVGLSWDVVNKPGHRLTLAADGLNPNDNAQSVNVGGEYALFDETLVLRGGYNELFLEEREKGLTAGAGVNVNIGIGLAVSAHYGYQYFKHLGNMNRFTLTLSF
jgi:hypothetical protein